jgi:hypothetical protein
VNFLNIGNRGSVQNSAFSSLRAASQSFAKLFNSRGSTSFGTTLQELENSQIANLTTAANSVLRQNLVAPMSNSRATAADASTGNPSTAPAGNASGLAAIFGGGISTGSTAKASPASSVATATSTVEPAAPPTPYTPGQVNSTDPGVYANMDYSEAMNLSANQVQANDENGRRYANYLNEFQNWQMNGSQGAPPQPPVYETVDQNGFQQWWNEYQQNMMAGNYQPPDTSMFLVNAPDYGNGYYGAAGSTQVGTLYNPTGPATADQVQAANNSQTTHSV